MNSRSMTTNTTDENNTEKQQKIAKEIAERLALQAYSAIINGDLERLKEVFQYRRVVFLDSELNTPIHLSAKRGQLAILK